MGGGRNNRAHANIQSPGDEWRTPGSRASADTQSPGDRRRTPEEEPPAPVAPMRQRFVPSMIPTTVGAQTLDSRVLRGLLQLSVLENEMLGMSQECLGGLHVFLHGLWDPRL